jgi:hypothetical protein
MARQYSKTAGIGDEAVKRATGRTWAQWCRALDKLGAKKLPHKEIARLLADQLGVGPWWSQMVTVGYEQARGLRQAHETPKGFQVGVSRTIHAPIARLYRSWSEAKSRALWLPDGHFTVRKATTRKSMRLTWGDGSTSVEVNFYAMSATKSQVVVQHRKLARASDVARLRRYWSAALDRQKRLLEP